MKVNGMHYKSYYWWLVLIFVAFITFPALFLGGVLAYLITLLLIIPFAILGIAGLRQQQINTDHFYATLAGIMDAHGYKYKDRLVLIGVDQKFGSRFYPPYVEIFFNKVRKLPIKIKLYYLFKGIIVFNSRLRVNCYTYIRRKSTKEKITQLLDKLSDVAECIEKLE